LHFSVNDDNICLTPLHGLSAGDFHGAASARLPQLVPEDASQILTNCW
jgi:hypothetical protein